MSVNTVTAKFSAAEILKLAEEQAKKEFPAYCVKAVNPVMGPSSGADRYPGSSVSMTLLRVEVEMERRADGLGER